MIEQNNFREDLLYRINTIRIHIPPLRERPDDIEKLAASFLEKHNARYGKNIEMNKTVLKQMQQYNWPGNIRELQHAIEKAVILCDGNSLQPHLLFPEHNRAKKSSKAGFNLVET